MKIPFLFSFEIRSQFMIKLTIITSLPSLIVDIYNAWNSHVAHHHMADTSIPFFKQNYSNDVQTNKDETEFELNQGIYILSDLACRIITPESSLTSRL